MGYYSEPRRYRSTNERVDTPSGKVELAAGRSLCWATIRSQLHRASGEPSDSPELWRSIPILIAGPGTSIHDLRGRQVTGWRARPGRRSRYIPRPRPAWGCRRRWVGLRLLASRGRVGLKAKLTDGLGPRVVSAPTAAVPERPGPEHRCFDSNVNVVLTMDPVRRSVGLF
jgi:hypothetical protein